MEKMLIFKAFNQLSLERMIPYPNLGLRTEVVNLTKRLGAVFAVFFLPTRHRPPPQGAPGNE